MSCKEEMETDWKMKIEKLKPLVGARAKGVRNSN